jgi:CHAT domain-containing protein
MTSDRLQTYIRLIQELLQHPSEAEIRQILTVQAEWVDAGLVQAMMQVATTLEFMNEAHSACFLRVLAEQLAQQLQMSSLPSPVVNAEASATLEPGVYQQLLDSLIQTFIESNADIQSLYPSLHDNLDKLDDHFAQHLHQWIADSLLQNKREKMGAIAALAFNISDAIYQLPQGNRANHIEIAIAGYEALSAGLDQEMFPEIWALTLRNLAIVYRHRVRGNQSDSLERAIATGNLALTKCSPHQYPEIWANVHTNLANVYCFRIAGDKAENLELAITAYQSALQIFAQDPLSEGFALIQFNLGATFYDRIRGERVDNLKQAINAYEAALQVFSRDRNLSLWNALRNNLMKTYGELAAIDQTQINVQRVAELSGFNEVTQFFAQALRLTEQSQGNPEVVYPLLQAHLDKLTDQYIELFSVWVQGQLEQMESQVAYAAARVLGRFCQLLFHFPHGNRATNLELAIAGYRAVEIVLTRAADPQAWAYTQQKLGDAYVERLRGDKAANLEIAIQSYEQGLQVFTQAEFPQQWAWLKARLGIAYKDRLEGDVGGNIESAITAYTEGLQILTAKNDPYQWAEAQSNLSNAYFLRHQGDRADNLERAISASQSALQVYTKEQYPQDWAIVQNNLGTRYRDRIQGDPNENSDRAIAAFTAASEVWTRTSFPERWASLQVNLGNSYATRPTGNKVENLDMAVTLQETALEVYTPEVYPQNWHSVQINLHSHFMFLMLEASIQYAGDMEKLQALLCPHLNQFDQGIFSQRWKDWLSAFLSPKAVAENSAQAISFAGTIVSISITLASLPSRRKGSLVELALQGFQAANQIIHQETDPEQWASLQRRLAEVYSIRIQGDRADNLELACQHFEAALTIYTPATHSQSWKWVQMGLGNVYRNRIQGDRAKNIETAIQYYQRVLDKLTPDADLDTWVNAQNELGITYCQRWQGNEAQNIEDGIAAYEAALAQITLNQKPKAWAQLQNNLGMAYLNRMRGERTENLNTALACFQNTLQLCPREQFPEDWARIQGNLGEAYSALHQLDTALAHFQAALQVYTFDTFPTDCLAISQLMGDAAFTAGRWEIALEGYQAAIKAIEQSRFWATHDLRRQRMVQDAIGVYTRIVETCIHLGRAERALEYAEQSKARNLVDLLANRMLYPKGQISSAVVQELDRLRREIAAAQRLPGTDTRFTEAQASNASVLGISDFAAVPMVDRALLPILRQQLNTLINDHIQPIDPTFSLTQRVEPIRFHQIRELLPDSQTVLVEWYITSEKIYTFLVTPDRSVPIVIALPSEQITALSQWVNAYLQSYRVAQESWVQSMPWALQQLADILNLEHLISLIPPACQQIILVPHRVLHLLPLHALPISSSTCLLDQFPKGVRYAPSAQLLQFTHAKPKTVVNHLLGLQNPTEDLTYADVEVATIQQYFDFPEILPQATATRAAVRTRSFSTDYYVHFSCHGSFNLNAPLESSLNLADAPLTLGDIFGLNWQQVRLVTLSACETGLTDPNSLGDEYIGLPSGFLYAGCSSVVSSLWQVNDLSTSFLMIQFYQNLQMGDSVAISLNQAQCWLRDLTRAKLETWIEAHQLSLRPTIKLQLRRRLRLFQADDPVFPEPFYWAGFCAIGD